MDYINFYTLLLIGMAVTAVIFRAIESFSDNNWLGVAAISIICMFMVIVAILVAKAPSEENHSKREILESQKIEVILDSNTEPVEDGQYREAISKDCSVYKGVITYTSDKKLDKTYQKVRYYGSFFYNEKSIIYLYDPNKA